MSRHVLSILVAFVAYSLQSLGKAGQKIGLDQLPGRRLHGIVVWILSALLTTAAVFMILYAASIGSIITVGAMAGTGLAALSVFTALRDRQPFHILDIIALSAIISGPFLLAGIHLDPPDTIITVEHLFFFLGGILALWIPALVVFRHRKRALGIVLAIGAGAIGGLVVMFQKLSASPLAQSAAFFHLAPDFDGDSGMDEVLAVILRTLANPFALMWFGLAFSSTVLLQVSFLHGRAIRLIPVYNSANLLMPILGGVLVFREPLHILQWFGVLLIVGGVMILSFEKHPPPAAALKD